MLCLELAVVCRRWSGEAGAGSADCFGPATPRLQMGPQVSGDWEETAGAQRTERQMDKREQQDSNAIGGGDCERDYG